MRKYLALIGLLLPFAVFGQRVPDNDKILEAISDPSSPYYYPPLMLRYEVGDTTLTDDDYHYLYYGFAFQEEYNPWKTIHAEDKMLMAFEEDYGATEQGAEDMIRYGKEAMKGDPFSPRIINLMTYAYVMAGDTLNAVISADRFNKIIRTIESSGTGLREKSPWHVLWFSHIDDVLTARGLKPAKRMVRSISVEYVELAEKDGDVKGYYFDFGRVNWRKRDMPVRDDSPAGFEINGVPVGRKNPLR